MASSRVRWTRLVSRFSGTRRPASPPVTHVGGIAVHQQADTDREERRTRGATAVEYALLLALIAGVLILAVTALGTGTQKAFQDYETELDNHGG